MKDRRSTARSVVLVVLGVCLGLWLSGCSSATPESAGNSPTTSEPDSPLKTDIRQALDATKALNSVHLTMRTNGQVDSMLGITGADVDMRAKPLAAKGDCTYQGQSGVPFRVKDDNISVKLFDDWTNLGNVTDLSATRLIDPINGVTKLLGGVTNLQPQGTEVIDGINTNKTSATLPVDSVKQLDPGARSSRPATVWIANDGSHRLVRASVDLGGGTVQVQLSKWNEPVNVD
ncbi:LppX_LprAFG lipoprotein [Mycobacterium sp.]|uniref:LppX_LprAFG lipoprotein n=1 Tax=Mycobacterium sp. TaxID=1785 RepID=UPI002D0877DA|nr:LppX_LprAFG lipoprotein [Mycobacterium sp.]HTQ16255.1 LppX_LprAFG lipoprotein [Mycobacterium sp.]